MLVHISEKKNETAQEIHLVPELCVMTGLSDQHRSDFHLMKELD